MNLIRQEVVSINDNKFKINIYEKLGKNSQNFVVVHDNENTAFDTALQAIKNGGKLITIENREQRHLENTHIDPNRIFLSTSKYKLLGHKITELLGDGPIISLHNNSDGGAGNQIFALNNLEQAGYKNIEVFNGGDDPDNAIWISKNKPYNKNSKLGQEIANYIKQGINVVYEYVPPKGNDTSLSNYAALNKKPYYNIEIEERNSKAQKKYLKAVLKKHRKN